MKKKNMKSAVVYFILGVVFTIIICAILLIFSDISNILPKKEYCIQEISKQYSSNENLSIIEQNKLISKKIPILAVSSVTDKGVVGELTVKLIPGNSNILINTNPFLETDLQYSANTAISVAKLKTGNYANNKDFILTYNIDSDVIGGESAGAATAIAAIAALEEKNIKDKIAITGSINYDGSIGMVGGILEKAKAAADAGYEKLLVPKGQTKIRYYEKVVEEEPFGFGFKILNTYYVPKIVDIKEEAKKEWGIELVEVSTIEEVISYLIE
ncbi:MAG: S16 family serine protease [Candidatus Woesearchaeota archaeon]